MKPSLCPSSLLLFYFLSFYFPHFIHRFLLLSLLLCPKVTLLQEKEALSKALEALRKQVADRTIVEDQVNRRRRRFLVRPSFNSLISTLSSHQYLFHLTIPTFLPSLTNTIASLFFSSYRVSSASIMFYLFVSLHIYLCLFLDVNILLDLPNTFSVFPSHLFSLSLTLSLLFVSLSILLSVTLPFPLTHSLSLSASLTLSLSLSHAHTNHGYLFTAIEGSRR